MILALLIGCFGELIKPTDSGSVTTDTAETASTRDTGQVDSGITDTDIVDSGTLDTASDTGSPRLDTGDTAVPAPMSWVQVPIFDRHEDITDSKVYALDTPGEVVVVFSHGRYLDPVTPRTSYVAHIDSADRLTLTDLRPITERNTSRDERDISDPHIGLVPGEPAQLWVSYNCDLDFRMCAIRSDDGGRTFDDATFVSLPASGLLHTTHEPAVTCAASDDCLLTWAETLLFNSFDAYGLRWRGAWCADKVALGDGGSGIPIEMVQAVGSDRWRVGTITPSPYAGHSELHDTRWRFDDCMPSEEVTDIVEADLAPVLVPPGGFPYDGGTSQRAPRVVATGEPTWMIYSADVGLRLRRTVDGVEDARFDLAVEPEAALLAGNVDVDEGTFHAFYHRFSDDNTYDLCFRTTTNTTWSGESCPLEDEPGPIGATWGNVIQPAGSVHAGELALVSQTACVDAACELSLRRGR